MLLIKQSPGRDTADPDGGDHVFLRVLLLPGPGGHPADRAPLHGLSIPEGPLYPVIHTTTVI